MAALAAATPLTERIAHEQTITGLDQALHLLWELCESSEAAVGLVNSNNLLPLVFACLRPEFPAHVAEAAGAWSAVFCEPAEWVVACTPLRAVGGAKHPCTQISTCPR